MLSEKVVECKVLATVRPEHTYILKFQWSKYVD
jgi:hypothetical protein